METTIGTRVVRSSRFVATHRSPSASAPTRTVSYGYDPLGRLRSATESGSTTNTYGYGYDLAGNRTSVTRTGTTSTTTSKAANQVVGWRYAAAGNLRNDGTTTSTYDALGRMVARGGTSYRSSGDGVLLAQVSGNTVISYTQDLAQPLPQILQRRQGAGRVSYLYGLDRLASVGNGRRTWEAHDALGSVRRTLSELGGTAAPVRYDPWGVPTSGSVPTFGFTGELHDPSAGLVQLRARWYTPWCFFLAYSAEQLNGVASLLLHPPSAYVRPAVSMEPPA